MKAEKFLQEESIKMTVNGNTAYYTRNELRAFFDEVFAKSGGGGCSDSELERILATLAMYDGDLYGEFEDNNYKQTLHKLLDMGIVPIMS